MRERVKTARRRSRIAGVVVLLVAAVSALAGCGPKSDSEKADGIITLSAPWEVSYGQNWNPYSTVALGGAGGGGGPALSWVYETLVRARLSDGTFAPWLAKSWDFSEDGKVVTFHLQPKATFSDGTEVTADDVVYSLMIPLEHPKLDPIAVQYTDVQKVDDKTVEVTWPEPAYSRLVDLFYPTFIVSKDAYEGKDPETFVDKEPIGSGPAVLDSFSPQQVTFDLRDDYWGGDFPMAKMRWVVSSSSSSQGMISNGTLDATCCIANYTQFVDSDPDQHELYMQPDGSMGAIMFNTAAAPFDDVNLRRAIASAVDIGQVQKLGEAKSPETFPPATISGLNPDVFGDFVSEQYAERPEGADPTAAKDALSAGGYTVEDGALVKDGKEVPLDLMINLADTSFGDAKSLGALLVQQFKENLGVDVNLEPLAQDAFSDRTAKGDFGMYATSLAFGSGRGLYWSYRYFSKDFLKPIGEAADGNNGRFEDATFDTLLNQLANTDDEAEQKDVAAQIQDEFVAQVPAVPLITAGGQLVMNSSKWTGWPSDDQLDHVPSIGNGPDFILTMMDLKPAS